MKTDLLPEQLRAARGLLDWGRDDLASASGVSADTILRIEKGSIRHPQSGTLEKLVQAFGARDVELTDDGVRVRRDVFREISPPDAYLQLLDDVFLTLKDTGDEALFFHIDNSLSSQAVIDSALRMRRNGIRFRAIINEEKPYCLFPLKEYRAVPAALFHNNPILVYADKVGAVIDKPDGAEGDASSCYVIRNPSYAASMRQVFEAVWRSFKVPAKTTAEVTYD